MPKALLVLDPILALDPLHASDAHPALFSHFTIGVRDFDHLVPHGFLLFKVEDPQSFLQPQRFLQPPYFGGCFPLLLLLYDGIDTNTPLNHSYRENFICILIELSTEFDSKVLKNLS